MPFMYAVTNKISISNTDYKFEICYSPAHYRVRDMSWESIGLTELLNEITERVMLDRRDRVWEYLLGGKITSLGEVIVRAKPTPTISAAGFRAELLKDVPITRLYRVAEAGDYPDQITCLIAELKDHMRVSYPHWEDPEVEHLYNTFKGYQKEIHKKLDKINSSFKRGG